MMSYVFFSVLPLMACVFWTAVFVLDWRESPPARRLLTVFMGVATLLYLCHAQFFAGDPRVLPVANAVYAFCNLAVYPLYYLYICRLTDRRPIALRLCVLLFLPAVIIGSWAVADVFIADSAASETYRLAAAKGLFFLQVIPVCCHGFIRLKDFDTRIENNYADTERRSVKPTRMIMLVLVICSLCSVTVNHFGREYFVQNMPLLVVPSLIFTSLLFGIGYVGQKQVFSIDNLEDEAMREVVAVAETDERARLAERLEVLMNVERLYLQPDLRLGDVAHQMGVSRTVLSAFINQVVGSSFSDYINTLRVKYAQEVMLGDSEEKLSMQGVGEMSGFTSESSFYRAFRKVVGMTPKEWSRQIAKNNHS